MPVPTPTPAIHPVVASVTARIIERSRATREAYLSQLHAAGTRPRSMDRMGCANLAHAVAGMPVDDRFKVVTERAPNIGIVTAYNDMLSAHTPMQRYPDLIKDEARKAGATAQVAGGVPAMCDGVTQGTAGMELSLFSRDVIAMATAVALSHDMFDAALMLGVCDKIVPGLLIGALHFGHLPTVFVPAGPMPTGMGNKEKAQVREQAAQGLVGRDGLLASEMKSYHAPGTCTFYGTANSNQMLLEAMGLQVPGTAFVAPGGALRDELTREAARTALGIVKSKRQISNSPPVGNLAPSGGSAAREAASVGAKCPPIGLVVDERAIVNAMVALLATGGSTNHLIHWVAVAQSAGIVIDWNDFSDLSDVVPTLAHVYPNGSADVNQFQAAGGTGYILRELLDAGLMHADVLTVRSGGLREFTAEPALQGDTLAWTVAGVSKDDSIVRPASAPFSSTGGLRLLLGNLGRSVIKVSSIPDDRHVVEAPARVFDAQEHMLAAFKAGELDRDVVCVVRWQGPQANGMPELHKLTPPLAVLQGKGFRVALVTDGRMSGASGKVPAAIHVSPEAAAGGPLAKVRTGDVVRLDAVTGELIVLVPADEWAARTPDIMPPALVQANGIGMGRQLFAGMRQRATTAEKGSFVMVVSPQVPRPVDAPLTALHVMQDAPVIPVIVLADVGQAVLLAQALVAGGIRMLEVTLRTPQALQCIEAIARHVPEAVVGAGTVRTASDAQASAMAGARFAVSPGYTHAVGQACHDMGLPLLPGVATGSEIMAAQADGLMELKFFPAVQAGGLGMLKAWSGPFSDVRFCPTGGVSEANAAEFLALPNVVCVGGSWLTPVDAVAAGDWARITALAQAACQLSQS